MEEKENGKNMLIGAVSLTVSVFIVKLLGFLYKLPISRLLGDEGLGYFNSAYTVFTFFYMLATGGIPKAVSILVTDARVKRNASPEGILNFSFWLFICIGTFLSGLLMIFSGNIAYAIGNPDAAPSLVAVAPALLFISASGVLRGYLTGYMRLTNIAVSEVCEGLVKFFAGTALAALGVRQGYGIELVSSLTILGVSIASFVSSLILYISAKIQKRKVNAEQNDYKDARLRTVAKSLFRISLPITLSGAILGMCGVIDLSLIINRLVSAGVERRDAIAYFGNYTTLAVPMLNLVSALLAPICSSALPSLTAAHARSATADFDVLLLRLSAIISSLAAPISFGFFFFPYEVLSLLFPAESAAFGSASLRALAPACIVFPLLTLFNTALEARGKTVVPLMSMSIGCIIKLILCFAVTPSSGIGMLVAPIGTTAAYLCASLISVRVLTGGGRKLLSVFARITAPVTVAFIAVGGAFLIYKKVGGGEYSVARFIVCVLIAAVIYALLFLVIFAKKLKENAKFDIFNKKVAPPLFNITKER